MYFLYSVLLAVALLCGTPYWLYQMLRHGKYRHGLGERLGFVPARIQKSTKPAIWIHAVSVGEVLAISELARSLQSQVEECRVVISTTTDAGQFLARQRFGAESVFYFPFDFKFCVESYFSALRPELIVIAETEFWPNFIRTAKRHRAHVAVVNARISNRSFPGYRRWRRVLACVLNNVDVFLAQTSEDARRLHEIGAPVERVFVAGNLKFDVPAPPPTAIAQQLQSGLQSSRACPVMVCGSTVNGEEPILLNAFKTVLGDFPSAVMLLAPRHPERFDEMAELLARSRLQFCKRSAWKGEPLSGAVLLIDTIGELASLYALADVAFVGGSLVPRGGHSILEPAQYGVAILVGPHIENFRDIVELFQKEQAVRVVNSEELERTLLGLLADSNMRRALGSRALQCLQSQRGATQFTLDKLRAVLQRATRQARTA
jgi:3-deoxy-D-manno-octulosonic-acid transferase